MTLLEEASNWATILTAGVAAWGYGSYRWDRCSRRKRLEAYLREEKNQSSTPAHTMKHLIVKLGMSEAEIYRAIFDSKHVRRLIRSNKEPAWLKKSYSRLKTTESLLVVTVNS